MSSPSDRLETREHEVPRALPRGPHRLPKDVVTASQRRRLLDAIIASVAEVGYGAATVADVIKRAGVSRTTFYELFNDKEDCFLTAYREGAAEHFQQVMRAQASVRDLRERLRAGVGAYVMTLALQPASARAFIGEIVAAGPRALELREEAQRRYVELLLSIVRDLPASDRPPAEADEEVLIAATAAIDEMIFRRLRGGGLADVGELSAKAQYVLLSLLALA